MRKTKMKTSVKSNGIIFEFDDNLLKIVEKALGKLKTESRKVLKNAVNKTARQAKTDLALKAQETYAVKKSRFTKAMATKNATVSRPEAIIKVTGEQLELKDFKTSPATYRNGKNRPSTTKAKVLLSSSMKPLERGNKVKAFISKFESGHVTVVQREPGKRYKPDNAAKRIKKYGKGIDLTKLKVLLSNSVPKMVGSKKHVFGVVEPHIYSNLMDNIQNEIRRVLDS